MKKIILLLALFTVPLISLADEVSPAKREAIRQLIKLDGSMASATQMRDSFIQEQQAQNPLMRPEFWAVLERELAPESLLLDLGDAYATIYTEEEIQAAVRFYTSPVGRSFGSKGPKVAEAMFHASQRWMQKAAERAMSKAQTSMMQ